MISTNKGNPLIGKRNGRTLLRIPNMPSELLVERLVEKGQPRRHALAAMQSPQLRACAVIFYMDCEAAEAGDAEAAARVDYVRESWQRMRRGEIALGNDPDEGPKPHVLTADKLVTL